MQTRAEQVAAFSIALVVALLVVASTGAGGDARYGGAHELFWFQVIVASTCAIGAAAVVVTGWRRSLAEVALLGAGLLAVSVLPLIHGLPVPGVLVGSNAGFHVSILVAVPLGLAILGPSVLSNHRSAVAIGRHWRVWTAAATSTVLVLSALLLLRPDAIPAPAPNGWIARSLAAGSLIACALVARRHLRLHRIGRRTASLVAAVSFVHLGLATLVAAWSPPLSASFWLVHVLDGLAVMGAVVSLIAAHRRDRSISQVLAPVVTREPLIALEIGLEPVVHEFLASLDEKDAATRDHVIRVGELAVRTGIRAGVPSGHLRDLGLGALLHDIGKLRVPTEILTKPGRLTDDEFEHIKLHTVHGARLMETSPVLRGAASFVRWHHERPDGSGYPDGLSASQIPFEVAIISAVDSWDAMTYDRSYQRARSAEEATAILREGSGTQWTRQAVAALTAELDAAGPVVDPVLDAVGRTPTAACDCVGDARPARRAR